MQVCDGTGDGWGWRGLTTINMTRNQCKAECLAEEECDYYFWAQYSGRCRLFKNCEGRIDAWLVGNIYECNSRDDNIAPPDRV
eukprot:UN03132